MIPALVLVGLLLGLPFAGVPAGACPRGRAARAGARGLAVAVSGTAAAAGLAAAYGLHEYVEHAARALTTDR